MLRIRKLGMLRRARHGEVVLSVRREGGSLVRSLSIGLFRKL